MPTSARAIVGPVCRREQERSSVDDKFHIMKITAVLKEKCCNEKYLERAVSEGAKSVAWVVTLADDGPTGRFFQDGKKKEW